MCNIEDEVHACIQDDCSAILQYGNGLGIRDIRSYMLSMQHCNKGGGYQWSQSSVQSRWWVGYVLLSEWLQCSLVLYIIPLQCYIGWVGGIRIRRKLGVRRKTAEGKP